jgi:peroxiredoxin Q/BCP
MRALKIMMCVVAFQMMTGALMAGELKVGDDAPEFELTGSDGKMYALSAYADKKVIVLAWFPKAFTGG